MPREPPGEKNRGGHAFWIDFGTEFGTQFCQLGLAGLQISCAQPVFRNEFSGTCPFQVMSSQGHVPEAWGTLHPRTPRGKSFKRHIRRSLSAVGRKQDRNHAPSMVFHGLPPPPPRHKPKKRPKTSNGQKIARMAPILTIFGPNRSRRCKLFFEIFVARVGE